MTAELAENRRREEARATVAAQLAALRDGNRLSSALLEEIEEELLARRDGFK